MPSKDKFTIAPEAAFQINTLAGLIGSGIAGKRLPFNSATASDVTAPIIDAPSHDI